MKKISFVLAMILTLSLFTAIPFSTTVSARTENRDGTTGYWVYGYVDYAAGTWRTDIESAANDQSCVQSPYMYNPIIGYPTPVRVDEISFSFSSDSQKRNDCALFKVYYSADYTLANGKTDNLTSVLTEVGVKKVSLSGTTVTLQLEKQVTGKSFMIYFNSIKSLANNVPYAEDGGHYAHNTIKTSYDPTYVSDASEYGVSKFPGTYASRAPIIGDKVGHYYQAGNGSWKSFLPSNEYQWTSDGSDRYNPVVWYNGNNIINEIVLQTNVYLSYYPYFDSVEVYYGSAPSTAANGTAMSGDPRNSMTKATVRKVLYDGVPGNYVRIILDETLEASCFMVYLVNVDSVNKQGGFYFGGSYCVYDPANEEGYAPSTHYLITGKDDPTEIRITGASLAPDVGIDFDCNNTAVVTKMRADNGTLTFDKVVIPDATGSGYPVFSQFQKLSLWYSDEQTGNPTNWKRVGFTVEESSAQQLAETGGHRRNLKFILDEEITASYLMLYTSESSPNNSSGFKLYFCNIKYYNRVINEPNYQGVTPRVGDPAVAVIAVIAVTTVGTVLSLRRRKNHVKI